MKRLLLLLCLVAMATTSCDDTVSSTYSTKYPVLAGFVVASYPELLSVVYNAGQYATIRQSSNYILMSGPSTSNRYTMDALSEDFEFGLGGLIVGTTYNLELRAYDLACPNCDRADRRLTLLENGIDSCAKCGITYDMNYDGVIISAGNGTHSSPRGLYRYRISYDGYRVNIYN